MKNIYSFNITVHQASTKFHHVIRLDTNSETIGVDNRATACISHKIDDFIGDLQETNRVIKGYMGVTTSNIKMGTIKWKWSDDQGRDHVHIIPNSYYSPDGKMRLLSPQHWARTKDGNKKEDHLQTRCITTSKHVQLIWGEGKYIKTIPLGDKDNVATLYSSPSYDKFLAFAATTSQELENDPIVGERVKA